MAITRTEGGVASFDSVMNSPLLTFQSVSASAWAVAAASAAADNTKGMSFMVGSIGQKVGAASTGGADSSTCGGG